jgi:hypothetical protein
MGKRDDGLAVGPLHARPRMTIVGPAGERSAMGAPELECPWRPAHRVAAGRFRAGMPFARGSPDSRHWRRGAD